MIWLQNIIEPILKAKKVIDPDQIAGLIQNIADDQLHDLWVEWVSDQNVKWSSKDKLSFTIWLRDQA